ncbi:MAG: winged helix-turn-helix transcriptional regulator [Spirochaetaceae bacterium]|nr:winged helix-turn-helix transcriptional regulator [Spirochaetaceae bacterium]
MSINNIDIEKCCLFFKVLGDPTRFKIIDTLSDGEKCVSEICAALDMSPSAVSHQLNTLKKAKVVKPRRDGKNIYYSFDDEHVTEVIKVALEHSSHSNIEI